MSDNEPLDGINQNTQPEDSFKHGFYFQLPGRVVGVALSVVGFFMIISFYTVPMFIGLALLLFGLYMVTGAEGIDINYSNKVFKEYNKILGVKLGKWQSLNPYPFITVMSANKSNKASDITGLNSTVVTEKALGIYFLSNSHRKKILLKRTFPTMEKAKNEAEKIASLTDKELMKYNPRRLL
jgi:hypothetical protein